MTTPDQAAAVLDGSSLSLWWGVPFAGLLLSIAIVPLIANHFWHSHYGKFALAWALAFLAPFAFRSGIAVTLHEVAHVALLEYLPFVMILLALFTIAGGISFRGTLRSSAGTNTGILALGAALASIMGTTGASMLLIRPLLTANEGRVHRAHVVVFFIVLVGNIGGALSPLGDPPLFIGFIKGIRFFWTTRALLVPTVFLVAVLLIAFFVIDRHLFAREARPAARIESSADRGIDGTVNILLLGAVIGAVLMSGLWKPGITVNVLGTPLELQNLLRDGFLAAITLASLVLTPVSIRTRNAFNWGPIVEVAKIFAGIFITILPVIAILAAGDHGALAWLATFVRTPGGGLDNEGLFWTTGVLSAFLDNAPTYLMFFNLAGGDAQTLMGPLAAGLKAISMAAVYFGALTYIGNAPNFMIRAIAEHRGVPMPSFFGYLAWATLMLVPLLWVVGHFTL